LFSNREIPTTLVIFFIRKLVSFLSSLIHYSFVPFSMQESLKKLIICFLLIATASLSLIPHNAITYKRRCIRGFHLSSTPIIKEENIPISTITRDPNLPTEGTSEVDEFEAFEEESDKEEEEEGILDNDLTTADLSGELETVLDQSIVKAVKQLVEETPSTPKPSPVERFQQLYKVLYLC
jgi:hypothetical protein